MTDDTDLDRAASAGALLRLATLVIGSIEVIFFLLSAHLLLQASDPHWEVIGLLALLLLGLTLPGLLLAWLDRAPRTALTLVVLALPVAALVWI
jgi:hypothetical protein